MDRVDPRLIDAALQGRETGEPALDRAALLVADLRRVLLEGSLPEAAGHLEAMAVAAGEEARGSTSVLSKRRAARRRRMASMPLAAALVLGTGLAWGAGALPDPASERAEEALATVQGAGSEMGGTEGPEGATHGQEVSAVARDDSLQGCEKGRAVSEVASSKGNRQGPGHDPCVKGDEGQAGGQEASAKGRQTAEDARAKAEAKAVGGGGPQEGAGPPENAPGADRGTGKP